MTINPKAKFNPVVMITYVVMMMISEFLVLNTSRWWDPLVSIPFNIIIYTALAWLLCAVASLAGGRWAKCIHIVCHALVFAFTVSNLFLFAFFHRHWDAFAIQFVKETTWREASEFAKGFIFTGKIWLFLVPSVMLFALEYVLARRVACIPLLPKRKAWRIAVACVFVLLGSNLYFFSPDYERNFDELGKYHSPIRRNNIWAFYQSVLQYRCFQHEYDCCAEVLKRYREHVTCDEPEADFVLIIGESFNRHYSNLYDGKWNTNPRLKKLLGTGRMFVFSNVIASDNGTSQNFKYLFSMRSVADRGSWCKVPLLPTVLHRCGYNVVYYGNQFVVNDVLGEFDGRLGFLNHPYIAAHLFDGRNTKTHPYDMGIVDDYAADRSTLEHKAKNFCIFHLYGQHMKAETRYPSDFNKFRADNVGCNDKTRQQREDIAHYLNATLYNDYVVSSIISLFERRNAVVLYLSDHGEEIHDFRNQYGRTDLSTDDPKALHPQLDIPFLIYLTPSYAKSHPQMAEKISRAVNKPFMSDDLPQVICDILGVKSHFVVEEKSVISPKYNAPQHRVLQCGRSYD